MKNESFEQIEQLEKYKTAVENLAKTKSSFIFPNKDAQHAAIVLGSIIENSNCIKICDDDLSGDIADKSADLRKVIMEAVESGKNVQFLIKDVSHTDSEIYKLLQGLARKYSNLQVNKAKDGFFENVKDALQDIVKDKVAINFTVGGTNSFRIEFPGEQARSAFCSFNNEAITSVLLNLFDKGFGESDEVFSDRTDA